MALTDVKVRNAKPADKPVKLTDSSGMHIPIHRNGSKYWRLQYRFAGKQKLLALVVYPALSLADARHRRDDARRLIAAGIDPSEKKKSDKVEQSGALAFESVARDWHASNINWSETHAERVINSLTNHVFPALGKRNTTDLKTRDLLQPIKTAEKSGHLEIAARLQQRITAIMRYAVHNSIIESNPAQNLAGAIATAKRVHRPALPFERITELLSRIESYRGRPLTRLAAKLTLLTFVRSSELRFARWSEIDFRNALWTIPAEREELLGMKHSSRGSKKKMPHLVPLSRQAVAILKEIQNLSKDLKIIFTGDHYADKPMSENRINNALRKMGYDTKTEVCGHGFRSMAFSVLIESGLWSKDAVERQMSHQERNNVRAAYIHLAQHLDERRMMLKWWAEYLDASRKSMVRPFEFVYRK
ncbi:integrase arm-type DNA-binding domain-containing protein [Rosenbergiella australiborealis]|uniref:Integrase arm-type DNA-binding domain-containing protein n=1 Tax=Rosenbergiella australiborealis TaxID=1544696 RepID=A0ABS5T444_9GAMM|nr:integrase arm-type DNA-binding domain-containing protein [Rosenbergiella australiborealis]MBT0727091.1 integrase arm-type DNA-binding domain-containing protein [Rosenbergiella australiborealis]